MHGTQLPPRLPRGLWVLGMVVLLACPLGHLEAQSLTAGQLRGVVSERGGGTVAAAAVTLEDAQGGTVRFLETDFRGSFRVALVAPGVYRLLVEQLGFQPIRLRNVIVAAGQTTALNVLLERRPPPIESVTEQDASAALAGLSSGRVLGAVDLGLLGRHLDLTDLTRSATELDGPRDSRAGLAVSAGGLPGRWSRLMVDGIEARSPRHPAFAADPAAAPAFARDAVDQAQVMPRAQDAEWRGTPGAIISAQTRRGAGSLAIQPYLTYSSATLGGAAVDNPADSTGSSLQVGAAISGALIPDTLSVYLRADYQRLQQPTAFPWEFDAASGGAGSLRDLVTSIAADSFGVSAGRYVQPTVRTWQGFSTLGRLDWRLSAATQVAIRLAGAKWDEKSPLVGQELQSGAGTVLDARDLSIALAATTASDRSANELRIGITSARRDWTAGLPIAATTLADEGVGFGVSAAIPAMASLTGVDISDALQHSLGQHQVKLGLSAAFLRHQQQYAFGSGGRWTFGDLNGFQAVTGDWMQVTGASQVDFNSTELGVFAQDLWQMSPDMQVLIGARYERQSMPANRLVSPMPWVAATGVLVDSLPGSSGGFAPRIAFVWDAQSRGALVVRGGVGVHYTGADPALIAEALIFSGAAQVRRGQGGFATWPAAPTAAAAPWSGTRLTLFSEDYRSPRALKADAGLSYAAAAGTTFSISGGYQHTDHLLRREDLNRGFGSGTAQGGRPVYGTLVRQGGLISPVPGSNRRFNDFDLVTGLVSDGYSDHVELTAGLDRRVTAGLTLSASYTFSRTEDNTPGILAADPADQLNPFPEGLNGVDWSDGRSDLDVPHRLSVGASWAASGPSRVTVGARYRVRSGLPFTPGFRPGVDVNGDGGGQNDPVFYGSVGGLSLAGCSGTVGSGFAVRNSCRSDMVSALDLSLAARLPVGGATGLRLTVEAFNVVSSAFGLVDRAALLVDPTGVFAVDASGNVTMPLVANPNFGTLLSKRTDPRLVRVGLRLEY